MINRQGGWNRNVLGIKLLKNYLVEALIRYPRVGVCKIAASSGLFLRFLESMHQKVKNLCAKFLVLCNKRNLTTSLPIFFITVCQNKVTYSPTPNH